MGGTGEETPTSKPSKPPASAQELPATPAYPDWSSPNMQAYYGAGAAPPFYAASPTPHPYLWSGQHAMIPPPYGTPIPYPQMYPAGGVYAHPGMAVAPSPAQPMKASHNASDGKNGTSSKKKRGGGSGNEGSAGTSKGVVDAVKATSASGNDAASQSAESGSEGSSDANEDGQQEYGTGKHVVSGAATNPNIGMDLWNANSKMRPAGASTAMMPGAQWNNQHDDREVKRQRRKQSNRESARRSRLRKQAECEELQVRVESLTNENLALKDELLRLSEECQKLTSENSSIKEELTRNCGSEADS